VDQGTNLTFLRSAPCNPCVLQASDHEGEPHLAWSLVARPPVRIETTSDSSGEVEADALSHKPRLQVHWQGRPPPFDMQIDPADPRFGLYNGELSVLGADRRAQDLATHTPAAQDTGSDTAVDAAAGYATRERSAHDAGRFAAGRGAEASVSSADEILILDLNEELGVETVPACGAGPTASMIFRKAQARDEQVQERQLPDVQGQWHGSTFVDARRSSCVSTRRGNGRCPLVFGAYSKTPFLNVEECETRCLQLPSCTSYSFAPGECFLFSSMCAQLQTTLFEEDDLLIYATFAMARRFEARRRCDIDVLFVADRFRVDVSNCEGALGGCRISPQQGYFEGHLEFSALCPEGNPSARPPCVLQDYQTRALHYQVLLRMPLSSCPPGPTLCAAAAAARAGRPACDQ